jgi:Holliday junction resolvase RusA-like endonuclease
MLKIIINGRPVPKKNSPVMVAGRNLILPSKTFRRYESYCLGTKRRPGPVIVNSLGMFFDTPVQVTCLYWLPDKRWWPDLVGLLQGTSDILEKAGILTNDRLIQSYDGSRIMGIDKNNPRAEITITPMNVG